MTLKNIIKNKQNKSKHFYWKSIQVFIKDELTNSEFSVRDVINRADKMIPSHLLRNIDTIYVGDFDFLNKREVQAMYENSSIFITNEQDDIEDMLDDLIHEIAHSIEEIRGEEIYSDGFIEREFLAKRKSLFFLLKEENYNVELSDFLNIDYDPVFDNFLYQEVGYTALSIISANLFYSPYGATSLREYFANGFEAYYFHKDLSHLKRISPSLFEKVNNLKDEEKQIYDREY